MTWEEAIRKSIRSYFEGKSPENLSKTSDKASKYNKAYFDGIDPKPSKKTKKKEVSLDEAAI